MPIRLLSPEVASQIAAGEVIERPASVVKEVLENSVDAGARSIVITILESGKKLIEVADDGSGIPSTELELAVARHATSKLAHSDELFSISTLGFRGEALASIGSVSRMTVTSRVANEQEGARLRVEGGIAGTLTKVGAPVGTTIRVEDLFYNVPARLKFLKSDSTERRATDNLITRYALAYPERRFRLSDGKNVVLQTSGDGDRRAILAALYGVDVAKQMLAIEQQYASNTQKIEELCKGVCDVRDQKLENVLSTVQYNHYFGDRKNLTALDKKFMAEATMKSRGGNGSVASAENPSTSSSTVSVN